jgi:hypothetical protein
MVPSGAIALDHRPTRPGAAGSSYVGTSQI